MPASTRLPLAAVTLLLLPACTVLLLSLSCCPVQAAADYGAGGGMAAVAAGAAPVDIEWRQRRLEDEVAPELGGMLAAGQGYISYNTLDKQSCGGGGCAARGASYTGNGCTYNNQCRGAGGG
ncbi:uncharacterized protein LOC120699857 [Panicum virgatum]|uniref:Uncharacterized protein n=1 Tax=Panicum virgatum TaxID=38727 RepID=A0A8T0VEH1_PANVG|nr:uncharacterized protein LOC120699857 [Panicum virgatum]KAG2630159.1 hypothetical protein PVAP13_3KG499200 [Panicum virgatum]